MKSRSTVAIARRAALCLAAAGLLAGSASGDGSREQAVTSTQAPALSCSAPGRRPITVVLVHGAWADTSSWDGEIDELLQAGCAVRAVENPLRGLYDDAATVAGYVRTIPGPVLLVGHSYGGPVITEAAASARNVVGLVYVDGQAPTVGENAFELIGHGSALNGRSTKALYIGAAYPHAPQGATSYYLRRSVFLQDFASGVPRDLALRLWAKQRPASTVAFAQTVRHATWKRLPSWYFISTGDKIVTPASERRMARRAHSQTTIYDGGSHLTLVTDPHAVTTVIADAVRTLLAGGKTRG